MKKMRVRNLETKQLGNSDSFYGNDPHKIIVATPHWVGDDKVENYEVYIHGSGWINLANAFEQRLVIPDNYYNYFRESRSDIERQRGYYE